MTEYMVVTQTVMAAGMLILAVLVYRGGLPGSCATSCAQGFNPNARKMLAGFQSQREEKRSDRESMSAEITSLRNEMKSQIATQHQEMLAGFQSQREEKRSDRGIYVRCDSVPAQ